MVDDAIGKGVRLQQSSSSGTARLQTSSSSVTASLREALRSSDAITVQVVFRQDAGTTDGARVLSWSSGTAVSDRNFSIIGDPSGSMYDNWTRLRTHSSTFSNGPDDCWGTGQACVYTFTYDENDGRVRVYLDGESSWSQSHSGGLDFAGRHFLIGNESTLDRPFSGVIYDVKIWDRALTAAQIETEAAPFVERIQGEP